MIELARIRRSKASLYLALAGALAALLVYVNLDIANDLKAGRDVSIFALPVVLAGIVALVGAPKQAAILYRAISPANKMVWVEGGRLFYISKLLRSIDLSDIMSVQEERLRRSLGSQPYVVVYSRSSGKKLYLHPDILDVSASRLQQAISGLIS